METFDWPSADHFLNRSVELDQLQQWHGSARPRPLALYGRRRIGKSWLIRRFLHGRPGFVLVAERLTEGMQLDRFARHISPLIGVTPRLDDAADLIELALRLGERETITVAIDEFPYLLPYTASETDRVLSSIQSVIEADGGKSHTRLIISGSVVAQMTGLFAERNPLHGRLEPFELRAMDYSAAAPFLAGLDPIARFERYSITGGAARYLEVMGHGPLAQTVTSAMLGPNTPLWNEGRAVVEQELRQPATYFSLLQLLATGDKEMNELAQGTRTEPATAAKYLDVLRQMRLVDRVRPIGADPTSRATRWTLIDPFLRFWFRFVFPFQAELEAGLNGRDLFTAEILPALADHVAAQFELWCHGLVRQRAWATTVGRWWGPALHTSRKSGARSSEEIDIVGTTRGHVTVVGEAKWTRKPMSVSVLDDLISHKVPALMQSGQRQSPSMRYALFSKSGYARELQHRATQNPAIELIDVPLELSL